MKIVVEVWTDNTRGLTVKTENVASLPDGRLQFMEDNGFVWCEVAAGKWTHWVVVRPDDDGALVVHDGSAAD